MPRPAADPASGRKRSAPHATSRPSRHPDTVPQASPSLHRTFSSFSDSPLPQPLVATLGERDIHAPFPIQAAALPDALAGRDILGRARTGSGKTLAFGLALLTRTAGDSTARGRPRALVLVPTRELAQQVSTALAPYARALGLRLATVVGGVSIERQIQTLRRGADVAVATPGRLTDLIRRGACGLGDVATTVIDEADLMADMGFMPQITALLDQVPADGQRMLFSATLDGDVDRLVRRYLVDPAEHSVDPPVAAVSAMSHHLLHLTAADKPDVVAEIAAREGRVLMFVRTKHGADELARRLAGLGVRADALHGDKTQASRTRTLTRFRDGHLGALVATDVAARGIDLDGVDLVVNVDPPAEAKEYLHRSGRTARAGQPGRVATLVLPQQRRKVTRLVAAAGAAPESRDVAPRGAELARVTGARQPSGVPVTDGYDQELTRTPGSPRPRKAPQSRNGRRARYGRPGPRQQPRSGGQRPRQASRRPGR